MEKYLEFEKIIKDSKSILIISHVNPDGDTLGSMCAVFSSIYKRFKKKADMLVLSKIPTIYGFLPQIKNAKHFEEFDVSREYDLVITVDVASLDRAVGAQVFFNKAKHTINVDHHITNNNFGELAFVDPSASSTGEVLFKIFKNLKWEIDLEIATSLYVAILTDTGSFRFENTSAEVFKIAAELTQIGLNPKDLYKRCYESKSKEIVLFQNYCVSKADFENNDKIAYTIVYKKDIEKFNIGEDATDGIAETLRAIVSTDVSFVVKEVDDKTCKISMRSKSADVAKICSLFNGGGHKFAAGCTMKMPATKAAKALLEEVKKEVL